jgi:hypothetical protein
LNDALDKLTQPSNAPFPLVALEIVAMLDGTVIPVKKRELVYAVAKIDVTLYVIKLEIILEGIVTEELVANVLPETLHVELRTFNVYVIKFCVTDITLYIC